MLKSTYRPSALPPGWTEHKAPTGHTYYHNASTGESTYRRPAAAADPSASFMQHQAVPALNLSDPTAANAFMAQYSGPGPGFGSGSGRGRGRGRGGGGGGGGGGARHPQDARRPRPQPVDKPRSRTAIPGCEPWVLVETKYGRRFAYNPAKNASYWRVPDKLKPGILRLDQERIRRKAGGGSEGAAEGSAEAPGLDGEEAAAAAATAALRDIEQEEKGEEGDGGKDESAAPAASKADGQDYDSSEYEEVEVTDEEEEKDEVRDGDRRDGENDDDDDDDGNDEGERMSRKRRRTEEPGREEDEQAVEFTEADIAAQLQAMGADYAADEDMDAWDEGEQGLDLSEEDARELFKDLLNDFNINPYSPWEKLIEEGKVFDDTRYTVLNSMKARRDVWEEWSRDKIKLLKEQRAREEKKDPRIAYMAFLQERATPKLYWPEFKRKYRKEGPMRDSSIADKDKEKWYREHVSRLKQPQATLKADLKTLLESVPLSELNSRTNPSHLPTRLLVDVRFISLDPKVRDPIVEAYVQSLPAPPGQGGGHDNGEDDAAKKTREERRKREKALEERERAVAEEKKRQEWRLRRGKADLREEERELERAMQVGKKGLQSQLAGTNN